jgi:hypothetical protein
VVVPTGVESDVTSAAFAGNDKEVHWSTRTRMRQAIPPIVLEYVLLSIKASVTLGIVPTGTNNKLIGQIPILQNASLRQCCLYNENRDSSIPAPGESIIRSPLRVNVVVVGSSLGIAAAIIRPIIGNRAASIK